MPEENMPPFPGSRMARRRAAAEARIADARAAEETQAAKEAKAAEEARAAEQARAAEEASAAEEARAAEEASAAGDALPEENSPSSENASNPSASSNPIDNPDGSENPGGSWQPQAPLTATPVPGLPRRSDRHKAPATGQQGPAGPLPGGDGAPEKPRPNSISVWGWVAIGLGALLFVVALIMSIVSFANREANPVPASGAEPMSNEIVVPPSGLDLATLRQQCAEGNMLSCDQLYFESPVGSEEEEFGNTCGNTRPPGTYCHLAEPGTSQSTDQQSSETEDSPSDAQPVD